MGNNKKNNIIMREFLQKFVDWIAMLLRWLYAAPNDAVQCQHDTRVEKLRDVSVRHVGRGLNSSELVKGRLLLAECKSFIRQRFRRMAVGVVLVGTALSASGQALNLDFHDGLNGWKLYYGAVLYTGQRTNASCSNAVYLSNQFYYWKYEDYKKAYTDQYGTDGLVDANKLDRASNAGSEFEKLFSGYGQQSHNYVETTGTTYKVDAEVRKYNYWLAQSPVIDNN